MEHGGGGELGRSVNMHAWEKETEHTNNTVTRAINRFIYIYMALLLLQAQNGQPGKEEEVCS